MSKAVKPTGSEQAQIDKQLKKKYPNMFGESWTSKLKKKVRKEFDRRRATISYQLGKAGVSKKKIKRMGGE